MTSRATWLSLANRLSSWCCWRGVTRQDLVCKHPAGLVQGIRGTPAPMVKFLPDAPTTLIQGVTSQVYDVEGIHDRPRAGELFSGCASRPGESIHRDDLNTFAPDARLGGQPGFEDLLGAARDRVQEPGGAAAIADGRHVQDNGDVPVLVRGVAPHVFIHAADAHAVEPSWIIDQ